MLSGALQPHSRVDFASGVLGMRVSLIAPWVSHLHSLYAVSRRASWAGIGLSKLGSSLLPSGEAHSKNVRYRNVMRCKCCLAGGVNMLLQWRTSGNAGEHESSARQHVRCPVVGVRQHQILAKTSTC